MSNYIIVNGELRHADILYHHGVKGQKWGVRNYQNKDGSLTAAGKARYSKSSTSGKLKSARLLNDLDAPDFEEMFKKVLGSPYTVAHNSKSKSYDKQHKERNKLYNDYRNKAHDAFSKAERYRDSIVVNDLKNASKEHPKDIGYNERYNDYIFKTKKGKKIMDNIIDKSYSDIRYKKKQDNASKISKKAYDDYNKNKVKIEDKMCEIVLKELGYENSKQAKEIIKSYLEFYDYM